MEYSKQWSLVPGASGAGSWPRCTTWEFDTRRPTFSNTISISLPIFMLISCQYSGRTIRLNPVINYWWLMGRISYYDYIVMKIWIIVPQYVQGIGHQSCCLVYVGCMTCTADQSPIIGERSLSFSFIHIAYILRYVEWTFCRAANCPIWAIYRLKICGFIKVLVYCVRV